ncbi:hypothetical protein HDU82_004942 [Entophlyctis luteolus]|nr:hypothetical protein HDU82_004942 [Entophlyctis luteolus]
MARERDLKTQPSLLKDTSLWRTVTDPLETINEDLMYHKSATTYPLDESGRKQTTVAAENARKMVFPRVERARQRVQQIEDNVKSDMSTQFEGLTKDQRRSVIQLVSRNTHLRELNKWAAQERKYQRRISRGFNYESLVGKLDYTEAEAEPDGTIQEFIVHEHTLASDLERINHRNLPSAKNTLTTPVNLMDQIAKTGVDGSTFSIVPKKSSIAEVNSLSASNAPRFASTAQKPFDSSSAQLQLPPIPASSAAQTDDAYGGFEVLLNASKPAPAESTMSFRLNVSLESKPPLVLVKSLKRNLGVDIKRAPDENYDFEIPIIRAFNFSLRSYRPKQRIQVMMSYDLKLITINKYGNWYIDPDRWNDIMVKSGQDKNVCVASTFDIQLNLAMDDSEAIDTGFVYALHTFVANVEGQVCVLKGDSLKLLDDSNYYWWLKKYNETPRQEGLIDTINQIGYIPAENIETPFERLARLNKTKNVQETLANPKDIAQPPATVDPTKPRLIFADSAIVFENYDDIDYDDDVEEEESADEAARTSAVSAGKSQQQTTVTSPKTSVVSKSSLSTATPQSAATSADEEIASSSKKEKRRSSKIKSGFLKKLWRKDSATSPVVTPIMTKLPDSQGADQPAITVLRIYTGNVDLKATYKAVALSTTMTTSDLLDVALKRFRVDNEPSNNYFLSVLFMDSGEKPLDANAIVFDALEALKNKNLPGVANFHKLEAKAKTSVLMNDDNIIKVIINKRLNIFEKNYHLIRVYKLDESDPTGITRTYKTIGVGSDALIEEVVGIVQDKFKASGNVTLNYFLSTKLKGDAVEKRRTQQEKIVDIIADSNGAPIDIEFILRNEPASPNTIRKRQLALENAPVKEKGTDNSNERNPLPFLDNSALSPERNYAESPSPTRAQATDEKAGGDEKNSDLVEPSSSSRSSLNNVALAGVSE